MRWAGLIFLLLAGCNPGVPVAPLSMASREGDTARIGELLRSGANLNEPSGVNGWTPLMHAVHKNRIDAVRALLAAGADVNAHAGAHGRTTALVLALTEGHPAIADLLRRSGERE